MALRKALDSQDLIISSVYPMGWLRIVDPYTGRYPRARLLVDYKLNVEYTFLYLPEQNEVMIR